MTRQDLVFRLFDNGLSFEPSAVPVPDLAEKAEGGYGVYLIKQSVDRVEYQQCPSGENCLTLTKHLGGSQKREERKDDDSSR